MGSEMCIRDSDVGVLSESGYRLESLQTFDMFSNTPHVEALVTLVDTKQAQED